MRVILKTLLKNYLKIITKMVLFVHRPTVIAIAGSTNKNFVKQEIKKILREFNFSTRVNPKNFNTEIGLPLAILYLPSGYNEYQKWLPVIFKAPLKLFQKKFPKFLVLSLGTSDEGDMKYLLSIVKPDISIITDITQRYKEGFSDMNRLVNEYELLAQKTKKGGLIILNSDNYRVKEIGKNKEQRVLYYGFKEESDARIEKTEKNEKGQKIILRHQGEKREEQIYRFGKHHSYVLAIGHIIKKELKNNAEIR